jgi:hypothetical protein
MYSLTSSLVNSFPIKETGPFTLLTPPLELVQQAQSDLVPLAGFP